MGILGWCFCRSATRNNRVHRPSLRLLRTVELTSVQVWHWPTVIVLLDCFYKHQARGTKHNKSFPGHLRASVLVIGRSG